MLPIVDLVMWWCDRQGGTIPPISIGEEFVFDMGVTTYDRADFMLTREISGEHVSVSILAAAQSGDDACVVFEATDSVTAMRHRHAWMLRFGEGELLRILACVAVVPSPS